MTDEHSPEKGALGGRPGGVRDTLWRFVTGRFDPDAVLAEAKAARAEPAPAPPADGEGVSLLPSDAVGEGDVVETMLDGIPVAVCRVDGEIHVLDSTCPHAGGPLAEGDLEAHFLVCPFHGWPFDIRTGCTELDPEAKVRVYAAREVDGTIVVSP